MKSLNLIWIGYASSLPDLDGSDASHPLMNKVIFRTDFESKICQK